MKKYNLLYVLIFAVMFALFGCSCRKEETLSKEEAINILKDSLIQENVEITTTTEALVNDIKSSSIQKDIYYQNKYYHSSENNNSSTQTWYGEINKTLYAFYYTKNINNEEIKSSSRIENSQLESVKNQPNALIKNLFDESGNLLTKYQITGTKKGASYTIQITSNILSESNTYIISISNNMITKIINTSNIANNSITTTYDYNYDVRDIELPSLSEYPLNVNG